jgi:hypothetical protein
MLQRGFPQVIDFLHRAIWHMDCSPPEATGWEGAMVRCSVARPATAQAISVAVDRFDDAPGQRITGQSSIDQSSDRSCTPRWLVHVIESALI